MTEEKKRKPILCVDFDGVIHSYSSGWQGVETIADPPVPGALKWLWKATEWFDVQIYSSRSVDNAGIAAMMVWLRSFARHEWGDDDFAVQFVSALKFPSQKPKAFLTIDDRCLCFGGSWEEVGEPHELLDFKPWNKRPRDDKPRNPA
ncbi:MAG TPA: hypothetical protein VF760_12450 [Xanthobacteraceae bacterium]